MTVTPVSSVRRGLPAWGVRRLVAMALGAASLAWPLNLGVPLGPHDALRVSDLVCGLVLTAWWLSGMRVVGSRMLPALLVSGLIISLGLSSAAGPSDLVFVIRLAEVPVIATTSMWLSERGLHRPAFVGIGLGMAALGILMVYEGWVGRAQGWVGLRRLDLLVSSIVPKENPGFIYQSGSLLRPSGPFDHPNAAAGVLALGAAAALIGWFAVARSRRGRLLLALIFVSTASGLLVSGSRGATVAALGGAVLSGILSMQHSGWRRLAGAVVFLVCVAAVHVLVDAAAGREYVHYLGTIGQGLQARAVQGRFESWRLALPLILDHPLFGVGRDAVLSELSASHNAFLFVALTSGVPLALLLMAGMAVAIAAAVRATASRHSLRRLGGVAIITAALLMLFEDRSTDPTFMSLLAFAGGSVLVGSLQCSPEARSVRPSHTGSQSSRNRGFA